MKRDSWCWRRVAWFLMLAQWSVTVDAGAEQRHSFDAGAKKRDSFNVFQRAEVPYALWCFNQSHRLGAREIRTTVISHLVSSIAQHFTPRFINCAEGCQGQLRRFVTRSVPRRSLTHWSLPLASEASAAVSPRASIVNFFNSVSASAKIDCCTSLC